MEEERDTWQGNYDMFQRLLPTEQTLVELKTKTIPDLERRIADDTKEIDAVMADGEVVKNRAAEAKRAVRDLQTLKAAASLVSRTLGEVKDLQGDIARLERDLEASGSTKTVEDVQREVDQISTEM